MRAKGIEPLDESNNHVGNVGLQDPSMRGLLSNRWAELADTGSEDEAAEETCNAEYGAGPTVREEFTNKMHCTVESCDACSSTETISDRQWHAAHSTKKKKKHDKGNELEQLMNDLVSRTASVAYSKNPRRHPDYRAILADTAFILQRAPQASEARIIANLIQEKLRYG